MIGHSRPERVDFFPTTRRGHGTTHTQYFIDRDGQQALNPRYGKTPACVDGTCSLIQAKSKNTHRDVKANLQAWCEEHGIRFPKHGSPTEAMLRATGGR